MDDGNWISSDGNLDYYWAMNALISRRTPDTVYFGLGLADALQKENGPGDAELANQLDDALLRACEALARVWKKEGNIPFLLNPHTEEAVWSGNSYAGARAISCLAIGSQRWDRPDLLITAEEIAKKFYKEGISRGETWGSCGDIMPGTTDSQSLSDMCEGLTILHEVTKNPEYLRWAVQASDLLATWTLDEMIEFPKDSTLRKHNIQPFGAIVASTQNSWGVPGLCVHSGRFLLDLYERTDQPRFMDLLSDIVRLPMQMMVRPGQKFGNLEPGQMTECCSFNDVPAEFGEAYLNPAAWPVNAMLINEVELPSVYIDGGQVWQLDHLTASIDNKGAVTIGNPTEFPAVARIQWRNESIQKFDLAPGEIKKLKVPSKPNK